MKPADMRRLLKVTGDPWVQSALVDLFAVGCFLHARGHSAAGLKSCAAALRAAGITKSLRAIQDQIKGEEREFALACRPHQEVCALFEAREERQE